MMLNNEQMRVRRVEFSRAVSRHAKTGIDFIIINSNGWLHYLLKGILDFIALKCSVVLLSGHM